MTAPGPGAAGAFNFYAITILRPGAAQTVILKQETTFLLTLSHPGLPNGLVMSQTESYDVTNAPFLLLFACLQKMIVNVVIACSVLHYQDVIG